MIKQSDYIKLEAKLDDVKKVLLEFNDWLEEVDEDLDKKMDNAELYGEPEYGELEVLEHQSYIVKIVKDKIKELELDTIGE